MGKAKKILSSGRETEVVFIENTLELSLKLSLLTTTSVSLPELNYFFASPTVCPSRAAQWASRLSLLSELRKNGKKVVGHFLMPGWAGPI